MKNLRNFLSEKTIICFFISGIFLTSCQKDVSKSESQPVATEALAPDTPTDIVEDNSGQYTTFSEGRIIDPITTTGAARTASHLMFEYTVESSSALSVALNSFTQYNSFAKCCSYSVQRSSSYHNTGSYSLRYELNKSDGDVAGSKRSEANLATTYEPVLKVERWYGMSFYLPSDYITDPAPEIVTQWQSPKGVQPPLAIWTYNGNWLVALSSGTTTIKTTTTSIGTYAKSAWTDFVVHVKWSTSTDGLIEVWKNGTKVFSKTGANTYTGQTRGNYLKDGVYKWPWKSGTYASNTTKRVFYLDDVRIGNNYAVYADVAP
ncbi:MAG: hypothetical protein JWM28_8 [Chitinophagaceae bacterium]|nr:hypothetical protein [Chitinophagaceae bacterium]